MPEIGKLHMYDNFNIKHLEKFCMVYNTIINHYRLPYTEYHLLNDNGIVILKRVMKQNDFTRIPTQIPNEVKNELLHLDNIFFLIPPRGFTLIQMKIINAIYKSLIRKGIMPTRKPAKSFAEFMYKNHVRNKKYDTWFYNNISV